MTKRSRRSGAIACWLTRLYTGAVTRRALTAHRRPWSFETKPPVTHLLLHKAIITWLSQQWRLANSLQIGRCGPCTAIMQENLPKLLRREGGLILHQLRTCRKRTLTSNVSCSTLKKGFALPWYARVLRLAGGQLLENTLSQATTLARWMDIAHPIL